ncbi:hypothetical protein [Blastococcus sp. LR1]|uniref:hypothetical protein n=1 Tax=Blastococcus sp. LR1 TaxID=2877000 RepID=UPI001CCA98F7|nr:hypothetical protein [Blastococcus sp. LR1]MCA0145375.1 hypothetical protein [Blastococcus sp. LR1]
MVTRIPAPRKPSTGHPPEVAALLARFLSSGPDALEAAGAGLLADRVDRLLTALGRAGLVLSPDADRLSA